MSERAAVVGFLLGGLAAALQAACVPCGSGEPEPPPAGTYALRDMEADPDPGLDPASYELKVTVTARGDRGNLATCSPQSVTPPGGALDRAGSALSFTAESVETSRRSSGGAGDVRS